MHEPTSNQLIVRVTADIHEATHWMPVKDERWTEDGGAWSGVTPDKHYRLFYDKYDKEYVIVNDRGQLSMIYLAHRGCYLVYEAEAAR
ncbi:hypothetical protein SAMN02799630_05326 [Paenibacillus sp. UNCCL117]|uniref:hypothetical protein n=1 Tax=unclassified Paenibacillus TaxID=185978 RepID=UPI00088B4F8D|nr:MULTISPECIES: hypothetical protein [unclassified Paenibacillus]SDE38634.1 hypothetical protein SAMN04488602_12672 [Paenibacillus sp. cl123]SFW65122.1 hypothetical protein SAMN02799630_05326 [Paenibacillus sp. UNCCL117]